MRGALSLAAKYRVGHLAAVGDVVVYNGVRSVLIVLCRGDFHLWIFVFDGVHPTLDGVRSEIAFGRVHLPGAGEVRFVRGDGGGEKEELTAMQRAVCRRGMIYLLGRTIAQWSNGFTYRAATGRIRGLE
jgi:hypothetical protein